MFREHLIALYENSPLEESDELSFAACSDYIDLALVHKAREPKGSNPVKSIPRGGLDEIMGSKTRIKMDEILAPDLQSPDIQPSFVLVEGGPGIGKTTFCRELCRKWKSLLTVQEHKIVLHLKLRQKRVQKAKSLKDLLDCHRRHSESANKDVVDAIVECNGEGILFVLDGFDELPASIVSDEDRLIMEIIHGRYLPKATRLVTGRPSALHDRNKYFPRKHKHVEILGFTDERKAEFAECAFKSDPEVAEHFKTFMLSNPVINSLMYIPVNCAILASVYKDMRREMKLIPRTMTQLYKILISVLIKRDMIKRGKWDEDTPIPSFEHLPEKVPDVERVCQLAYEGLFKREVQLEFTDSDTGKGFQHLGLLVEMKERGLMAGVQVFYSFLHLSIQEFLAACYVSWNTDLIDTVIPAAFVDETKQLHRLLWPQVHTWSIPKKIVKPHLYNFGLFLAGMVGYLDFPDTMDYYILYCLYEAQDAKYAKLLHVIEDPKALHKLLDAYVIIGLTSPMDMYVLGYALVHAPVRWSLTLNTACDTLVSSLIDHVPPTGEIAGSIVDLSVDPGNNPEKVCFLPKSPDPKLSTAIQGLSLGQVDSSTYKLLPSYPDLKVISLTVGKGCPDDLVYQALGTLANLSCLDLSFAHMSSLGLQELVNAITQHSTLDTIRFSFRAFGFGRRALTEVNITALKNDFGRMIVAALSCANLKVLEANDFPFVLRKSDVASTSIAKDIHLKVKPSTSFARSSLLQMKCLDCLWSVAEVCEIPSLVTCLSLSVHSMPNIILLSPPLLCEFLGDLSKSLQCNHSMKEVELSMLPRMNPCDSIKYLSRNLRQDPALSHRRLRRSKSLNDLIVEREARMKRELQTSSCHKYHFCPELLEIESLRILHAKLRAALMKNAYMPWLSLKL